MLHIMVVDDEAPIRDWLVYCIQKCEAASSVTSAVNGEEVLIEGSKVISISVICYGTKYFD